ncbi:MAG: TerB family tellurite resistance protein [Kiloniellales bacterium]|nr:TerB family tellurite resistance protein [Kiloniellales bacterium]
MFARIKALLSETSSALPEGAAEDLGALEVAAAALLVEAALMDGNFDPVERGKIAQLLARRFELGPAKAETLIETAEAKVRETPQLYGFTRVVKDEFAYEDRVELIEMLWEVAYADGELHDFEASLMRRIAGLIYVSDRDSGAARKRAFDRSAAGSEPETPSE